MDRRNTCLHDLDGGGSCLSALISDLKLRSRDAKNVRADISKPRAEPNKTLAALLNQDCVQVGRTAQDYPNL